MTKFKGLSCFLFKFYNNGMDSVDIMDQKTAAYRLHRKRKYHFYLSMLFDLMDVTHVNGHIVYMKLGDDMSLLTFKIVAAKALIGRYSNRNRSFSTPDRASESIMNHP